MGELQNEIKELRKLIEDEKESKKEKKFKLPFMKKVNGRQARKNYVTAVIVNENGHANFVKTQIVDESIMIDGIPRLATPEYIVMFKKNPMIFIPSWSVQPLNLRENFKESLNNGTNTNGYKILLAKMKSASVDVKKKMGGLGMAIGGFIIVAIIVYAIFFGGGS